MVRLEVTLKGLPPVGAEFPVDRVGVAPVRPQPALEALDAKAYLYTPMTRTAPGALVRACFQPVGQTRREECFEATVRRPAPPTRPPRYASSFRANSVAQ
ncbi:hypothetical protein GCM10027162_66750 [Streptomyces incanus]